MNALVVVNPISGDIDKDEHLSKIKEFTKKNGFHLAFFKTTGENDVTNIKSKVKEFNPDRIIVMGGDGTIKLVIESTLDFEIPIGIIPCGSANGLATSIDLPKEVDQCIPIAFGSQKKAIDLIQVNKQLCIHLSDMGFNAEMIKNYENNNSRGFWGYSIEFMKTLSSFEGPFNISVEANGQRTHAKVVMLVIANASKYGTGFQINPKGEIDDGKFELVLVKDIGLSELIKLMSNKEQLDTDQIEIISTKEAKVHALSPNHFQVDGEYIGKPSELAIKILPQKVALFC